MAFDGITVRALADELNTELSGGRIAKIAQPETDELLLTIKNKNTQHRLCISANASLPLVYLASENKPGPMTAPNFCMLLRKHISNGRITRIAQPKLERILRIEIDHLDELGDVCHKVLIVEIMGKHSNIIFCDDKNTIIDSIKHIPAQVSSVREVLPGRPYFIPDTMGKQDPLSVTEETFARTLAGKPVSLSKAIYTGFTGISPVVAEDICFCASLDSRKSALDLADEEFSRLSRQFFNYMEEVRRGHFHPGIYFRTDGTPQEFCAIPISHYQEFSFTGYSSISEVLRTFYAAKNTVTRIHQKSADLRRVVQTALERNRKKYDLQSRQLQDTQKRETYKVYGELINAYGYNLGPDAEKLTCQNYYTGEAVTIPLDPAKTPQENAQRYFARYNKQKRAFEALSGLIQDTADDIRYLESISNALDIALGEEDLAQIKEELIQGGYIRRRNARKKAKFTNKPLHYLSSDGYHMYVGKNNLQNDELTFSFASGNDWWFHAKQAPGSHVIVKTNGGELPDRTFEEAGRLAAFYSKKRGSDKVEIDYVEKKHVKKPNGAKPGFVVYYTNYSLVIDADISGILEISS